MVRKLKDRQARSKPKEFEIYATVREYIVEKAEAEAEQMKMIIDTKKTEEK